MTHKSPFFIVGSVLSGTTLLRNVLRHHPNLIAPEETHVFRWGDPFGTETYTDIYKNAETLKLHRKIDTVSEKTFFEIYAHSTDRKSLMNHYFEAFMKTKNQTNVRCFDKSPQNVYGIVLLKAYYPNAQFLHIIRHPLNVIASILRGHPGLSNNILGAINYWKEAILIINELKKCWDGCIHELMYEELCENPANEMAKILSFLGESPTEMSQALAQINPAQDNYSKELQDKDIQLIYSELGDLIRLYYPNDTK